MLIKIFVILISVRLFSGGYKKLKFLQNYLSMFSQNIKPKYVMNIPNLLNLLHHRMLFYQII